MSKVNYDLSKIKGVIFDVDGVLSPCVIPLGNDGNPQRMANIRDGYALQLAVRKGLRLAIISGAAGDGLEMRFKLLGINDVYLKVGNKLELMQQWMHTNALTPEQVAYVGDDIPDRDCMDFAGLAVAPADGADDIVECAQYVSPCKGGYGVARDLLEQILRAQNLWPRCDRAFGWEGTPDK